MNPQNNHEPIDQNHGVRIILTGIILTLLSLGTASAQYAITWSTIDGGGGTSTGGVYSVTGTIGQPDAGTMSGGSYTLDGGFWSLLAVVQTPGAPVMAITRTNNAVIISWLASSTGFVLQENPVLGTTNWTDVATSPTTNGLNLEVLVPSPLGNWFYRLRSP